MKNNDIIILVSGMIIIIFCIGILYYVYQEDQWIYHYKPIGWRDKAWDNGLPKISTSIGYHYDLGYGARVNKKTGEMQIYTWLWGGELWCEWVTINTVEEYEYWLNRIELGLQEYEKNQRQKVERLEASKEYWGLT